MDQSEDRRLVALAYAAALLALVWTVLATALLAASLPVGEVVSTVLQDLSVLGFSVVGVLILRRHPRQAIGWICVGIGLGFTSNILAQAYTEHALVVAPGSLPGGPRLVLLGNGFMGPVLVLGLVLLPLLFPTGAPPSPRWRWLHRAGLWLVPVLLLTAPFGEDELRLWPTDATEPVVLGVNPFLAVPGGRLLQLVAIASFFATFLLMPLAVTALVQRYRHATGVERQQLRWFRASLTLLLVLVASLFLLAALPVEISEQTLEPLFAVAVTAVPVSIGIAVTRYRLYDIDRIISRTVGYGVLTALLVILYAVATLALGSVARSVAREGGGDLVVAASTLLVAAAFGPLRRRVQSLVDRRFHRARYDLSRTVEGFGQRLRHQVDVGAVRDEMLRVTAATVQPTAVSLWLPVVGPRP